MNYYPRTKKEETVNNNKLAAANITNTSNNPSVLTNSGDSDLPKTITTYEDALAEVIRLRSIRDALLEQKTRDESFLKRYSEKVQKSERMATLRQLIPRELFVRQDRYDQELEHVYNWSGITDEEIADIYRRRMNDVKIHGASSSSASSSSSTSISNKDPFRDFRGIPDFHKASVDYQKKVSNSDVSKLYGLQKKIAGNNDNTTTS